MSIFGTENPGGDSEAQLEELSYAEDLIERIQRRVVQNTTEIEQFETLGGQIDTLVEQRDVLAAKISAATAA